MAPDGLKAALGVGVPPDLERTAAAVARVASKILIENVAAARGMGNMTSYF